MAPTPSVPHVFRFLGHAFDVHRAQELVRLGKSRQLQLDALDFDVLMRRIPDSALSPCSACPAQLPYQVIVASFPYPANESTAVLHTVPIFGWDAIKECLRGGETLLVAEHLYDLVTVVQEVLVP